MQIKELDETTRAIHLKLPGSKVVLLQGFFETYEGLGTVRTIDVKNQHVAVFTTKDLLQDSLDLLDSIQDQVLWE